MKIKGKSNNMSTSQFTCKYAVKDKQKSRLERHGRYRERVK